MTPSGGAVALSEGATDEDPVQDERHNGTVEAVWNLFDLTPEGRGTDRGPKPSYD